MATPLDPLLTDLCNDYGPVGSDIGADTPANYRDWRSGGKKRETFLQHLFRARQLRDEAWEEIDESRLREQLKQDHFQRLVGDDTVLAFAFAQLIVDGDITAKDRQRALWVIERQALPCVLEFRGWSDPQTRLQALAVMRQALLEAPLRGYPDEVAPQ